MKKEKNALRPLCLAAWAGLLALGACKGDEPEAPPTPLSTIQFVHSDYQVATSRLSFSLDGKAVDSEEYGQAGSYLTFTSGTHTLALAAGTATGSITVKLEPGLSYSFFAIPAAAGNTIGGRLTTDYVLGQSSQARIRLINLLTNAGSGVELAQLSASGNGSYEHIAYDAEAFSSLAPTMTNLTLRDGSGQVLAQVGTGRGNGAGTKKYEDGHVYTAVAVGDPTSSNSDARPRVYVLTNL